MAVSALDSRLGLQLIFWYGVIALGALMLGGFLATDQLLIALMVGGFGWLILLPYHAPLAVFLAVSTFNSAFILPFVPGRPYVWEFAGMLAWTGVIMNFSLRRYPRECATVLSQNRLLVWSSIGYCCVLIVTMFFRGFGLRILGSEQMGGRYYFQQIICAIFPLLFLMVRLNEKTMIRLFVLQCLFSATYLVSDFVFSVAPKAWFFLLSFFELSNDALGFEMMSQMRGVRRFQSLSIFGGAFVFLVVVLYRIRDFMTLRGFFPLVFALSIFALGLMGGHRMMITTVGFTLAVVAYTQRFYNTRNLLLMTAAATILLIFVYTQVEHLPQAVQRSISFLPGLTIDPQARYDAESTMMVRKTLFRLGLQMVPDYFWVGRGFARFLDDYSLWDPTTITFHISQGKFYNGVIGLLINTGFFGAVTMLGFMYGGTKVALRIIRHLRTYGTNDTFSRVCAVVAGQWVANAFSFIFLHGDSEWAMKTFSLQVGMLLVCDLLLRKRLDAVPEATPSPV